jgi:hypothetical protein
VIESIVQPEHGLTIRELEPPDEAGVLELMAASEDFFVSASGLPAAPADVQSLYYSLPEGVQWEDKLLIVAVEGERVVAVIDARLTRRSRRPAALLPMVALVAGTSAGASMTKPCARRNASPGCQSSGEVAVTAAIPAARACASRATAMTVPVPCRRASG